MAEAPGTDLVYAGASLEERKGYALALSKAGELVPKGFRDRDGSANPGKILLAAEYGNMLGIHPVAALTGINVIDGKPTPAPALMSGLVRKAGHKLRVRVTGTVKAGDLTAVATLVRADDPDEPFVSTWDIEKARRAGLWDKSGSWKTYPEAMLKWRAISEVCRDGAEDVLMGAHYTPEELGANVNEAGEVVDDPNIIDAEVVTEPPSRPVTQSPGPGRATPPPFDPAPWEDRLAACANTAELHHLWDEALRLQALDQPLSNGDSMRTVILRTKERMEQDAAEAPATSPVEPVEYDGELPF